MFAHFMKRKIISSGMLKIKKAWRHIWFVFWNTCSL